MRFRIKQVGKLKYFAQVKHHWYSPWLTIHKSTRYVDLIDPNWAILNLSLHEYDAIPEDRFYKAEKLIEEYKDKIFSEKNDKYPKYTEVI